MGKPTICIGENKDAVTAKLICASRVKLVCFSFFVIRHSSTGEVSLFFVFRYSFFVIRFSFFDIRTGTEFLILTFKILF